MERIEDYSKILPIIELYTAVQSEGSRAGYPTVVVRTTGCTHRCFFGEGGWCDSWYSSIHPEKGKYSIQDIIDIYDANPHISEMMLTGGAPTMHPALVNELTHIAHEGEITITIETEGSHFLKTDYPIGLVSISPKFSNSIPQIGVETPQGDLVDDKMVKQHNKFRLNIDAIADSIMYHKNFHIKPVLDNDIRILGEVISFVDRLADTLIEKEFGGTNYTDPGTKDLIVKWLNDRIWFMPAGDTREALQKSYPIIMNWVRDNGYKMTFRPHIIAFNDLREV